LLVTFKTDACSNAIVFGNVALTFLRIMGHSGTVQYQEQFPQRAYLQRKTTIKGD
jgi:hypothetical protein